MLIRYLLPAFLVIACAHQPSASAPAAPAPMPPQKQIVVGCQIFDEAGRPLRRFGGERCLFFDDGHYVIETSTEIRSMDQNNQLLWSRPLKNHHMLTLMRNHGLLVGSSEIKTYGGKRARFDVLIRLDANGVERQRFSFYQHRREFFAAPEIPEGRFLRPLVGANALFPGVEFEFSHMNSFYETPAPDGEAGDILVNTLFPHLTIMIFDSTLSQMKSIHVFSRDEHMTKAHDVQMLENGHLLLYDNVQEMNDRNQTRFSTLDEVDPVTWKPVWRFIDQPRTHFYSPVCGGVQLTREGTIFFSDLTGGTVRVREINRAGHELRNIVLDMPVANGIQDAKLRDLSKFLQANQAP